MRIRVIAAVTALSFASALLAQTSPAPADAARRVLPRAPGRVALSPDGTTLAYTLRTREGATLHVVTLADPDPAKDKLITASTQTQCSNGDPLWSPDSQTLAFTSSCTAKVEKPGQEQIFLWSRTEGSVKQLTHVTGNLNQPAWSPDGKSIAFLFVENATRSAGALDAMKPFAGVIGEDGVEVQHLAVANVATGEVTRDATIEALAPFHVYEFNWAPNSKGIAFIGANPPGENNWWIAKLYVSSFPFMAVCTGQCLPSLILDPVTTPTALHGLQIAVPRYSPDGKRIALIGGLMSDQGSTGGDVWVVDADGKSAPIDITPNIDGTPTWEIWLSDHTVGFVEDRRGHILFTDADADKHSVIADSAYDLGEVSVGGGGPIKNAISGSNTGLVAYVQSSVAHSAEIYVGIPGKTTALTHFGDGLPTSPTRLESIEWTSARSPGSPDAYHVQGWLTYPANYDPAKKYPLIVQVHGGPSASAGPRPDSQFSALGYFVLAPNPRGSFGQGEAFTAANRKDFGYGDLRDILAGVDAVEKRVSIDDHRLGLTGWSYGGFMSMFAETQTNRFAAIVAGAGISNWQSYYGENSIDQWMVPFFGATVYDDPAVYAKSSALSFIKNAKTPMLIIVGDRDGECPAPQSFEMWHALKAAGVKTQLVVYPNEGHGFRDPEHIKDRAERTAKWFADNMPAK